MYAFAVVSVALLAGQGDRAALTTRSRSALAGLLSRQTTGFDPSDIPAQCQSDCSTVVSALNSCVDVSCLCSENTNRGLYTCLECALAIEPDASLLQQGQSSLEDYQSSCKQAGVSVTPLVLTLPSGASATSGTGSSAGSVSSRPSATFNTGNSGVTATVSAGASTPTETDDDDDDDDSSSGTSDPLSGSGGATRNGAALVSASSVAVAGVVGAAMAVLAL
ncbi:hypothetical protein C8Q74DRAFT_1210594 [Fomes fomentarius]|nr:hypothetical protein C8Q74DRAFT_1210594 [Fomes fomentarius]